MLAKGAEMPEGADWVYEPKIDGLRCLAYVQSGKVSLVSRVNKPITAFPDIEQALTSFPDCILDGEVCVLDKAGTAQFNLLQQRTNIKDKTKLQERQVAFPASYFVFDLLELDGHAQLDRPLTERKGLLHSLWEPSVSNQIRYTFHSWRGPDLLAEVRASGGEGIVAKNLRDPYLLGSRRYWVKVKFKQSDEFMIVGWVDGKGWRTGRLGALIVATSSDTGYYYVAKVGTGFDVPTLERLLRLLEPLTVEGCPVSNPFKSNIPIHWIKPDVLVAEVEFQSRTKDGFLRSPVFKGIREDKTVADLRREGG